MELLGFLGPDRSPEGIRAGRREVRVLASGRITDGEALDDVGLLASEVLTNAYEHAVGPITVLVIDTGAAVRVEVRDGGPKPHTGNGRRGDHGRGLELIRDLASDYRLYDETSPARTPVWFEVRYQ
jgi:anti-sigma regulatory factor (Ser/Thr protein kinase)